MRAALRMLPAALVIAGAVAAPAQQQPAPVPEPYDAAEFAPALRHLRRGEIVAVGAFPFALLLSTFVYDYARWAGDGFSEATAPFGRALDQDPFDDDEKVGIVLASAGVALAAFGLTGVSADEIISYPYWCIEKGYGTWVGPRDGSAEWTRRARGWIRVMYVDAIASMLIYTAATAAFYVLGAAVLHVRSEVP